MHIHALRPRILALLAGIAAIALSGWVLADPPSRVARLGYVSGSELEHLVDGYDHVGRQLNRLAANWRKLR